MRTFDVMVELPKYTPAQALQMHLDEEFQASAAAASAVVRTVFVPGHIEGDAYERVAQFDCEGEVPPGYVQSLLRSATPKVRYNEKSRYYLPPRAEYDINIISPPLAANCVAIHVGLEFSATAHGTSRLLHGEVEVSGWIPRPLRPWTENLIATQMAARLGGSAAFAKRWAQDHPERYPDEVNATA